jgi:hypothetical protein
MENKNNIINKDIRQNACYKPNKNKGFMVMCGVGRAYSFRIKK